MALGVASVLGGGGLAAPAGADPPTPTVVVHCDSESPNTLFYEFSGFVPHDSVRVFDLVRTQAGNSSTDGVDPAFQADGTLSLSTHPKIRSLPAQLTLVVYHESYQHDEWQPNEDETVYSATATLDACNTPVTMSPK